MSSFSNANPELFVRKSSGFVREASAFDAVVFNAVFSAPVGAVLAWGIFFSLSAFPGANLILAILICVVLNVPIIIMMSSLAASMPRTGGDYVWVSRILSPPMATISSFSAAFSALIGATFWARYFPVYALGPALVTYGSMFSNKTMITWGNNFQTNNVWIFFGSLSMILIMTFLLVGGTKRTLKWMNISWIIASAGTFLAFLALAIGSKAKFITHFNALSAKNGAKGDSYAAVIAGTGHPIASSSWSLTNWNATLPTVFVIMTFMMWNYWSVYLAGELKGAGKRSRHEKIMFSSLGWNAIFLIMGIALLYKTVGYNFMAAANTAGNKAYVVPSGPWYHFLASLSLNVPVITFLVVGSFLFWSLPAMVGNVYQPVRALFAWSFDRLLPAKLADVNPKTHSPVPAIMTVMGVVTAMLIWSIKATTFSTWLALGVLAGVVCIIIVAIAAFTFPTRRKDLYQNSPSNVNFMGIPVLRIVSPLSALVMIFLTWMVLKYPALAIGSTKNTWWVPAFIGGIVVVGLLLYYIPKMVRRSQGINIDLVYQELPPE
jgi:APA family basic amino acid/polyamine antiporter